jgi:MFS family permease
MAFQLGNGSLDDFSLTVIGALGGLVNGGSRIFWGNLQDTYGFKRIYSGILICQLFISLTIIYAVNN